MAQIEVEISGLHVVGNAVDHGHVTVREHLRGVRIRQGKVVSRNQSAVEPKPILVHERLERAHHARFARKIILFPRRPLRRVQKLRRSDIGQLQEALTRQLHRVRHKPNALRLRLLVEGNEFLERLRRLPAVLGEKVLVVEEPCKRQVTRQIVETAVDGHAIENAGKVLAGKIVRREIHQIMLQILGQILIARVDQDIGDIALLELGDDLRGIVAVRIRIELEAQVGVAIGHLVQQLLRQLLGLAFRYRQHYLIVASGRIAHSLTGTADQSDADQRPR